MELFEITKNLLAAKKEKSLSFADLETVVGRDEVWIAAVFYRQASSSQEDAEKIVVFMKLCRFTECLLRRLFTKNLVTAS